MKKMICAVLTVLLLLSVGVPAAFAAHRGQHRRHEPACEPAVAETIQPDCKFTDENQDGICDNRVENGGTCENSSHCENSLNRVDENEDGICDRRASSHHGQNRRSGCGRRAYCH